MINRLVLSTVIGILILGGMGLSYDVFADKDSNNGNNGCLKSNPNSKACEKNPNAEISPIRIDNIYGDAQPQFSAKYDVISTIDMSEFLITNTIDVYDLSGNYFRTLSENTTVEIKPGAIVDSEGFIELQFQYINWSLYPYCGNAQVTMTSQLMDSNGQEIGITDTLTKTVWLSYSGGCGY